MIASALRRDEHVVQKNFKLLASFRKEVISSCLFDKRPMHMAIEVEVGGVSYCSGFVNEYLFGESDGY